MQIMVCREAEFKIDDITVRTAVVSGLEILVHCSIRLKKGSPL